MASPEDDEPITPRREKRATSPTGLDPVATVPRAAEADAAARPGPQADAEGVDGVTAAHAFTLDHVDARGHRWQGSFRCHVLTIRDRLRVGIVRARLLGGQPPESVDASTVGLAEQVAHLTVALDDAPDWFKTIEDVREPGLLDAVYREVAAHEERFHRAGTRGAGGTPRA